MCQAFAGEQAFLMAMDRMRLERQLPDADCRNCEYMKLNNPLSGGHCYMFRDKPGRKCGQFKLT